MKRWWSLAIALLIVALLVAALGDPQKAIEGRGRTVVILVDASASMQATDVRGSRLDQARKQAMKVVARLDTFDRALVAQLDESVTPLTPVTDDRPVTLASGMDLALKISSSASTFLPIIVT